ncbi:MAG TPA: alpha/beta hydrolase [Acidimicrobiia bacterium]|nr:alpha/beta hydrolase [Acidimicrobiia bacterium]
MSLRTIPFDRDPKSLDSLRAAIARGAPSADVPLAEMRANFERLGSAMPVGEGIEHETVTAGDRPAEWTRATDSRPDAAILHFHGGGYVLGSPRTTRTVTAGLARHTGLPVLAPDYRLAPEHPFPAAIDDAVAAYTWLTGAGFAPDHVVISGDSAGGGLTMALLLALRDRALPLPAGAIGISPMLDLTLSSPSLEFNAANDPQVTRAFLELAVRHYLPPDVDPKSPLGSPMFANLTGLPPLLLQAGGDEGLLDDSVRFGDAAEAAGVDVTVESWTAMMHVWHMLAPRLPEAEAALASIATWVHALLGLT